MTNLLKILHTIFIKGPLAILLGLLQLIVLLIVLIPTAIARLCKCLKDFFKKMNFKEEEKGEKDCNPPFPEPVFRRPDPCIYSQSYLASQGLPVTWDNPDIWMAKAVTPHIIEPDSYHLLDDTDYLVSVRVHNASTDLALGVKVRLLYRPWSFNSPDLIPVQVNNSGQEVLRFVNIPGMGSSIAQFLWHTPAVSQGGVSHYCIQAHVSHPLDLNLLNNMGQENTNVHSANPGHVAAGEVIEYDIPLFNHTNTLARFFFQADAYKIEQQREIELKLQTTTGRRRMPLYKRISNIRPALHTDREKRWKLRFQREVNEDVVRARYTGFEEYRKYLQGEKFELPPGMKFHTPDGGEGMLLRPKEKTLVKVFLQISTQATTGDTYSINIRASREKGELTGGVTFLLNVKN